MNVSPFSAFSTGPSGPVGFTDSRSAENAAVLSAGQALAGTSVLGIGQTSGDLLAFGDALGASAQLQYGAPVILGIWTYLVDEMVPLFSQVDGLVYTDAAGSMFGRPADGFEVSLFIWPEPSSIMLVFLAGMLSCVPRFRRLRA